MSGLKVGIGFVERVTRRIVGLCEAFMGGHRYTAQLFGIARGIASHPVFVEIIAQVQHQIEVGRIGDFTVGVEKPGRIVRARADRDIEALDRT